MLMDKGYPKFETSFLVTTEHCFIGDLLSDATDLADKNSTSASRRFSFCLLIVELKGD